jgi:hypothetical protein
VFAYFVRFISAARKMHAPQQIAAQRVNDDVILYVSVIIKEFPVTGFESLSQIHI